MTMDDIKKNYLGREAVILLLTILGYLVNKSYKFKLRNDEKTASALINTDGTIHDFGDNFHGDIFKLLKIYHGMFFIDALAWVKNQLNIPEDSSFIDTLSGKVSENDYTLKKIGKIILNYENKNKDYITFKNDNYAAEALQICPLFVFEQANDQALKKFKEVTTFDVRNKTIVIKIYDDKYNLISFKWRRLGAKGKWITAKGTHPNGQCLYYIVDDNAPIYIVEGHHDYLTAILLNNSHKSFTAPFNVIMIPTVNYCAFNKYEINLMTGKDVYFLPDLNGDDMKGIQTFEILANQVEPIANDVALVSLAKFMEEYNAGFEGQKLDLSLAVEQWEEQNSYSFVNHLLYFCDTGLKFNEQGVF